MPAATFLTALAAVAFATFLPTAGQAQDRTLVGNWAVEFHLDGPASPTCIEALGDRVVVGGGFRTAGPILASHLAWYDADGWHAFDAVPGRGVSDLFPHAGTLAALTRWSSYPGDADTTQIWTLAGNAWHLAAELAAPDFERAAISYQGDLYAGGWRWDGQAFIPEVTCNGAISDLAVLDDLLVVAGDFTVANGETLGHVVAWNGSEVVRPWPASDDRVERVAVLDGEVWTMASYGYGQVVRRWTGGEWETRLLLPGDSLSGTVGDMGLFVADGQLYVSYRGVVNWSWYEPLRRWDAASETFVTVVDLPTRDAAVHGDGLVIVHDLPRYPSPALHHVHFLPGLPPDGEIQPLHTGGLGLTGRVIGFAAADDLMVGGAFVQGGGRFANGVLRRIGGDWVAEPFVSALNAGTVSSVGSWGSTRYVSGREQNGCIEETGVYRLEGEAWTRLHAYELHDLTSVPAGIFGRDFSQVRRASTGSIVGTATGGWVRALTAWDGDLVAGGSFDSLDGALQGRLARLDGSNWRDIGDPLEGDVTALGTWQEHLVVAGELTLPEQDGRQVIVGNGGAWQVLPGLFDDDLLAIREYGDLLVVGGEFTRVGELAAAHVAAWDGSAWRPLGPGCDDDVTALTVHDDRLWLGGHFHVAGGVPAHNLTWWQRADPTGAVESPPAPTALTAFPNPANPATNIRFSLSAAGHVRLDIHDLAGRHVAQLLDAERTAGTHAVVWRGTDGHGRALASGVYLARLTTAAHTASQAITLVR
jgi:hypothetical protein